SRGNSQAVSPKGAMGLMQIMPETWAALRARHALGSDPFDSRDNIHAGTAYLREMHDRYGSIAGMLAAYNAGPGRYDEHLISGRTLPVETRAYVAALAPMLGGEALAGSGSVAMPPADWREAPLFVGSPDAEGGQSGGTPAAQAAQFAEPSDDASTALAPQSKDLFVRRSDAGAVQ
ncbi:lytic transglycosylase domain-containing protein, partial [Paracoccus sp. MKU1]|uniref:lytic transglycosylase domain-containing protein n=1 Tax=Paracoccus sp. MKU1 TaxID=1745182 RepID=UPI0007191A83